MAGKKVNLFLKRSGWSHTHNVCYLRFRLWWCGCAYALDVQHVRFPLSGMGVLTPSTYRPGIVQLCCWFFPFVNKNAPFLVNTCYDPQLRISWGFMEMLWKLSKLWTCTWKYGWCVTHDVQRVWNLTLHNSMQMSPSSKTIPPLRPLFCWLFGWSFFRGSTVVLFQEFSNVYLLMTDIDHLEVMMHGQDS